MPTSQEEVKKTASLEVCQRQLGAVLAKQKEVWNFRTIFRKRNQLEPERRTLIPSTIVLSPVVTCPPRLEYSDVSSSSNNGSPSPLGPSDFVPSGQKSPSSEEDKDDSEDMRSPPIKPPKQRVESHWSPDF